MQSNARKWLYGVLLLFMATITLVLFFKPDRSLKANEVRTTNREVASFKLGSDPTTTTTTTTTLPPTTTTTTLPPTTTTTFVETTTTAPIQNQDSGVDWYAIAMCESSLGTGAPQWHINTGNGYYGGLQFSHSTWIAYGGGRFAENAHLTSAENQIAIASTMSLSHWPHCGRYG